MRRALRTRHAVSIRVWSELKKELINNVAIWEKDVFIENGANDVSYKTNSVVLSLNDVLVLKDSVTKENVKLYKILIHLEPQK